ncbi:DUF4393 domain-containing protein [Haloechinothrix halophila]|uniref:DUF4393 domain-containing protein n=1 Tax=Haloechinothrix halophila YIM 93223 TaxID=592678 RepID=W9DLT6_9PSEU|nr:DUF4393 domain-containing protein [Haloechinothrix halophila]ETA66324.1 hypothetical protein AmyhaDRAFT_0078 [Haloechinothrix halophila YIM 93223]
MAQHGTDDEDGKDLPDGRNLPARADEAENHEVGLLDGVSGLARVAATGWWRATSAVVETTVQTSSKIVKSALNGASPAQIVDETATELRTIAQRSLGFGDENDEDNGSSQHRCSEQELKARGAALLQRSADVRWNDDMHPAYERILEEIAPDEARILKYLALNGAQPTVDVRTTRPFGVGSELVAERLSMIGEEAGCRHLDRTNAYLNNLFRLGLLWFSKEKVEPSRYQVVEVQPIVQDAMKRAGRSPSTVHRSVHLTPFGVDFCKTCLPLDSPGYGGPIVL